MQYDKQPKYHTVSVSCSCGNSFQINSTCEKEKLMLEVCSECHPFYTGKQKIIDTGGRLEKFGKKYGANLSLTGNKRQKPESDDNTDTETSGKKTKLS